MKIVKIIYDLETTGLDLRRHAIVQLAGTVLVDDQEKEMFNFQMRPFEGAEVDSEALRVTSKTKEDLNGYGDPGIAFYLFIDILSRYINRYDRDDKAFLVGYNNAKFDDQFLRQWFELNKDRFYGSWFYSNSIDVMSLASEYLIERRQFMPNFKLSSVADELGIYYNPDGLHDAMFDVNLTRRVYEVVTGMVTSPAEFEYSYYKGEDGIPFKTFRGETPEEGAHKIQFHTYKKMLKRMGKFDGSHMLYDPLF